MNIEHIGNFIKLEWYEHKDLATPYDLESIMVCLFFF